MKLVLGNLAYCLGFAVGGAPCVAWQHGYGDLSSNGITVPKVVAGQDLRCICKLDIGIMNASSGRLPGNLFSQLHLGVLHWG